MTSPPTCQFAAPVGQWLQSGELQFSEDSPGAAMNATIQFTCPHCSHTMNLPSSAEGKQGKCPSCSDVVTIVTSVAETPADVAPQETEAPGLDAIDPAMEVLFSQSDPPTTDPPPIPPVHETPLDQKPKGNTKGWKEKLGDVKNKVADKAGIVASASHEKLKEKLQEALQEIDGLRPLLLESGFIIGDVYLTASITPCIGLVIEQQSDGVNHLETVIEDNELSKFQASVMSSIKKIYDLNDIVEKHNHTIGQIDIALGVSPEVTAHLNSKDSRSFSSDSLTETEREK